MLYYIFPSIAVAIMTAIHEHLAVYSFDRILTAMGVKTLVGLGSQVLCKGLISLVRFGTMRSFLGMTPASVEQAVCKAESPDLESLFTAVGKHRLRALDAVSRKGIHIVFAASPRNCS